MPLQTPHHLHHNPKPPSRLTDASKQGYSPLASVILCQEVAGKIDAPRFVDRSISDATYTGKDLTFTVNMYNMLALMQSDVTEQTTFILQDVENVHKCLFKKNTKKQNYVSSVPQ